MKKILTIAATIAVAVTGLTTISSPQAASAVSPTLNVFDLNVANQGAGSAANSFIELGGKTYFVASTLSKATSIWSVDGDITKEPVLEFDPFAGSTTGRIERLWGYDKHLFFWLLDTQMYSEEAWVFNVETKQAKRLRAADGTNPVPRKTWFTQTGGNVYGFSQLFVDSEANIVKFNQEDMTVSLLTRTPGRFREFNYGYGYLSGDRPDNNSPAMFASGNFLYVLSVPSNQYSKDDSRVFRFDLITNTWSIALSYNNAVLENMRASGPYTYQGEEGFVLSRATVVESTCCSQNLSKFESYFVKNDGTIFRLGSWISESREAAPFNFNGELYMVENNGRQIYKLDSTTGERTNVLSVMFPDLSGPDTNRGAGSIKEVGDKLLIGYKKDGISPTSPTLLYAWDGVNAATRFTDVNPPVGSTSFDFSYSGSNSGGGSEIGAIGNFAIKVLHRDETIGAEPYYIAPDGTVTLMKDMNKATDGSTPATNCFNSTPTGDAMTANLPVQSSSGQGQSVIVSMKPEGSFLEYSVLSTGEAMSPCGFAFVGDDMFFTGLSAAYQSAVFKISPNGTVTKMEEMLDNATGVKAFSYGGDYYWLGRSSQTNLYKYDVSADTVTQLTGKNGDLLGGEILHATVEGSKLIMVGETRMFSLKQIFVANLEDPVFSPVNISADLASANSRDWWPSDFTRIAGKVVFSTRVADGTNDVYEVNTTTNEVTKLIDVDASAQNAFITKMMAVDDKLFILYNQDGIQSIRRWTPNSDVVTMPLRSNFRLQCVALVGGNLVIQAENGQVAYYGNGFDLKPIGYNFGQTGGICLSVPASHGVYLAIPEYPYDQAGLGFGYEPGYLGALTPIAVSRLGQAVNEAPSVPKSSAVPSETAPAAPGVPGTPVATSGAGKVSLTWSAPTTGGEVARYFVESTPAGAQCEIVGTTADCIGLVEGINYSFTVTATNAGGLAASSASNTATPGPAAPAPGVPGTPTGVGIEDGVELTWTAPADGGPVDSYIVQSSPEGGTCVVTGTTARCTGLGDFSEYTFTVIALNDTGLTVSSVSEPILSGDPTLAEPNDPQIPVLTPLVNSIKASVAKSSSGGTPTYFRVRLFDENGDRVDQCFIYVPDNSCVFANLNPEMSYYAVGRAYNDNGSSDSTDDSDPIKPLAASAPGIPGVPTIEAGIGKLTVTATAPTEGGQVLSYDVTLSPGGATCTITAPAVSCEFTGLDAGTNYTATMVAKNDLGTSASSEPSAGVTPLADVPGKPDAPTLVAGPGKVTATVTPPSSGAAATSYLVTLSPGSKTCVITAPATTCEITGLDSSVAHTASVIAKNSEGDSVASDASSSVTPLIALPSAPAAPTVVVGNAKATVTAAPSMTGGAATSLKVTATPGGAFCVITLPATSCEITGLTNKTSYTFTTVATNASGDSAASVQSAAAIPVDPNADVAPVEGDGGKAPKGIPSGGVKKFVATNDSSFQVAWDKKTGKLISRATGIYTGYIEAKVTFTKAGKVHTCTAVFGTLKVMPQKTAAQKAAAMKSKTFTGKQFCIDKTKLNPATLAPRGGMTSSNFKKIKPMSKSAAELSNEKAAATALRGFTGQVDIQVIRYRAWPTTMVNIGAHNSTGGKIPALVRNTKVTLG